MKALYWLWTAIISDLGIFLMPMVFSSSKADLLSVVVLHATSCAVVASCTWVLLPWQFKSRSISLWLLLFSLAFMAPVAGAVGLLYLVRVVLRKATEESGQAVLHKVDLPVYDVQSLDVARTGQGAIRSRLGGNVPAELRMQSLLTLQSVPSRVANPILENLLSDKTDDVRLVAFGMLDSAEKSISSEIQHERMTLQQDLTKQRRYDCLCHLAELHWELVDVSVAQGELRKQLLEIAGNYIAQAVAMDLPVASGHYFLQGRILLARGKTDEAQIALQKAKDLGHASASVVPYLAEIAFLKKDFDAVKKYMQNLIHINTSFRVEALISFWTGINPNKSETSDRRFLPHL